MALSFSHSSQLSWLYAPPNPVCLNLWPAPSQLHGSWAGQDLEGRFWSPGHMLDTKSLDSAFITSLEADLLQLSSMFWVGRFFGEKPLLAERAAVRTDAAVCALRAALFWPAALHGQTSDLTQTSWNFSVTSLPTTLPEFGSSSFHFFWWDFSPGVRFPRKRGKWNCSSQLFKHTGGFRCSLTGGW